MISIDTIVLVLFFVAAILMQTGVMCIVDDENTAGISLVAFLLIFLCGLMLAGG